MTEKKASHLSPNELKIEPAATAQDLEGVDRLWREVYGTGFGRRYAWAYQKDPSFASLFVAKAPDRSVTGMVGTIRRRFWVDRRVMEAWQMVDFVTAPTARNLVTALALQKHVIQTHPQHGISLLYGFPNEKSVKVQLRAGFKEMGLLERWIKPLNLREHLEKMDVPLAGMLASIGNTVLRMSDSLRFSFADAHEERKIDRFDRSVTTLWETASARFTSIGYRDAEYLNWRFVDNPETRYEISALVRPGSLSAAGYIVYTIGDGACCIADMLMESDKAMFLMLMMFSRIMRNRRVRVISFQFGGDENIRDVLMQAGFLLRERKTRVLVFAGSNVGGERIKNLNSWYLTEADRDVE